MTNLNAHPGDPVDHASPDQPHFNTIAPYYYKIVDAVWYDNGYYHQRELASVIDTVAALGSSPLAILDAGCGPGRHAIALARLGHNVTAVDYAPNMLHAARETASRERLLHKLTFVTADLRHLPFPNQSFDIILCIEVLEHLPRHMNDACVVLSEFARLLRPSGTLIIEAPLLLHEELRNKHPIFRASWKEVSPDLWNTYNSNPLKTWNHFTLDQLKNLLDDYGFSINKSIFVRVLPAGLIERCPSLLPIDQLLETSPAAQPLAREVILVAQRLGPTTAHYPLLPTYSESTKTIENCLLRLAQLVSDAENARDYLRTLTTMEEHVRMLQQRCAELTREPHTQRSRFDEYFADKEAYIASLKHQLLLASIAGPTVPLLRFLTRLIRRLWNRTRSLIIQTIPPRLRFFLAELKRDGHDYTCNSTTTLYVDRTNPFPGYPLCERLDAQPPADLRVSLIVTTKNEAESARRWFASLICQTRLPDEVVIVDGGSSDGTIELINALLPTLPFSARLIQVPGCNIARGRNIAIEAARHPVVAVTDFGCELHPKWLHYLTAPFQQNTDLDVVAGWYLAKPVNVIATASSIELVPHITQVQPSTLLPSSRSLAFRKSIWREVGGYPEHLTATAEDTLFALELRRTARRWAFVPGALVYWEPPTTLTSALRKAYWWAFGDGEAALFPGRYIGLLSRGAAAVLPLAALLIATSSSVPITLTVPALLLTLVLPLLYALTKRTPSLLHLPKVIRYATAAAWLIVGPSLQLARAAGFVRGVLNRRRLFKNFLTPHNRTVFILSGVPFTDSGGGQRAAQLAREFLRRGDIVVFLNKFPSYESRKVNIRTYFPNLILYQADTFHLPTFFRIYTDILEERDLLCIVEFPLPDYLSIARQLKERRCTIVYDLIDDWTTSLGSSWYKTATEQDIAATSDLLIATAPSLQSRLHAITGRRVHLVPNAVDNNIFDHTKEYPCPPDLPTAQTIITYVGALWGTWIDWALLRRIASAYPTSAIVLIGDAPHHIPNLPSNVHLLGLRPYTDLPAYLAHSHVTIIPWVRNEITKATSPLKVYEHVAMGRPVVAPALDTLRDIPYVFLSDDHDQFIENIAIAAQTTVDLATIKRFVDQHTWARRVDLLLSLLSRGDQQPCGHA